MSNKCPMCGNDESEHSEVLKLLKKFDDMRTLFEMTNKLLGVDPGDDIGPNAISIEASNLYRKLKIQ